MLDGAPDARARPRRRPRGRPLGSARRRPRPAHGRRRVRRPAVRRPPPQVADQRRPPRSASSTPCTPSLRVGQLVVVPVRGRRQRLGGLRAARGAALRGHRACGTTRREGELVAARPPRRARPGRPATPAGTCWSASARDRCPRAAWRVTDYPGAANATIAAAMVRLGGVDAERPRAQPHVRLRARSWSSGSPPDPRPTPSASTSPPTPLTASSENLGAGAVDRAGCLPGRLHRPRADRGRRHRLRPAARRPAVGHPARHARDQRRGARRHAPGRLRRRRARRPVRRPHARDQGHGALPARRRRPLARPLHDRVFAKGHHPRIYVLDRT